MKVHGGTGAAGAPRAKIVSLEGALGGVLGTLLRISQQQPKPVLWPVSGTEPGAAADRDNRRAWSQELAQHFRDIRRHAKHHCPAPMLPQFELQLSEIEATARAAVSGLLPPFLILGDHIRVLEAFQNKWVPYIDPPPEQPPRLRCSEGERAVWLDDRCLARELDRKQFGFVRSLVTAYPDPVKWEFIQNSESGCRGANQTRVRDSLPHSIRALLESGPKGYALRLPDQSSKPV